jgi:hypothetical protein
VLVYEQRRQWPSFGIELTRADDGWLLDLTEHAAGTEQQIEVP